MANVETIFSDINNGTITKVDDINGTMLIESFINSNGDLEYSTYTHKDGGIIELDSDNSTVSEIIKMQNDALNKIILFNIGETK